MNVKTLYRSDGTYLVTASQFADEVLAQFHRTEMGQRLAGRKFPGVAAAAVDAVVRHEAQSIYAAQQLQQSRAGLLGYHSEWDIILPSGMNGETYKFSIIGLADDCASCARVMPPTSGKCLSSNPDLAQSERTNRLNVAFHELGHKLAKYKKLPGNERHNLYERHIDEVRSDVFGALMEIRLFGGKRLAKLQALSDDNVISRVAYLYFDPRVFASAYSWVRQVGVAQLQAMTIDQVMDRSNAFVTNASLSGEEVQLLADHVSRYPSPPSDLPEAEQRKQQTERLARITAYQKLVAAGQVPDSVTVDGKVIPYSGVSYQFDLAVTRRTRQQGSPYKNHLAEVNPLRDQAFTGSATERYDLHNPAQVKAINEFNRKLFGNRACIIDTTP